MYEESDHVENPYAHVLVIVYAVAGLCIVLFFTFEDAPWHYSRRVETMFLAAILLVVYVVSMAIGVPAEDMQNMFQHPFGACYFFRATCELLGRDKITKDELGAASDYSRMAVLSVQHVMLLILMVFLMQRFVAPSTASAYYEERRDLKEVRLARLATAKPLVVRWAREMNHCLSELEEVFVFSWAFPTSTLALCLVSMCLLMLSDFITAVPAIAQGMFLCMAAVSLVMHMVLIFTLVKAWQLHGKFARKVTGVVKYVVEHEDADALKYLVACVSLRCVLECSRDVLLLLTRDAIDRNLLGTMEKAMCIYALQNIGMRSSGHRQEAVKRILLSTFCEDMTELKQLVDGTGNYHNLYKLVYHDISSEVVRKEILAHLSVQSKVVRGLPHHVPGIKVCSDIDDTLYSSGGHFPAGCDGGYPKGVVYPGCLTLFRILDKTWTPHSTSSNLAFLSARPHVYKSWAERKSYDCFRDLMDEGRLHSMPTMIPGQLGLGLWAMLTYPCLKTRAWERVGEFKYQTYKRFARLYLEYDFVFCGDDGQGDVWAGDRMTEGDRSHWTIDEIMDVSDEEIGHDVVNQSSDSSSEAESVQPPQKQTTAPVRARTEPSGSELDDSTLPMLQQSTRTDAADPPRALHDVMGQVAEGGRSSAWSPSSYGGRSGGRIRCVLIHEVCQREKESPLRMATGIEEVDTEEDEATPPRKLIFHGTYVGAAVALHKFDPTLVSLSQLRLLCEDAMQEFEEVRLMYADTDHSWDDAENKLAADLFEANKLFTGRAEEPLRSLRTSTQVMYRANWRFTPGFAHTARTT